MTFNDITCMSDRSEEVIIETFTRRNDTPFFTTRSCRLSIKLYILSAILVNTSIMQALTSQAFSDTARKHAPYYSKMYNLFKYLHCVPNDHACEFS